MVEPASPLTIFNNKRELLLGTAVSGINMECFIIWDNLLIRQYYEFYIADSIVSIF